MIVPAYNAEKRLPRAIDSVLAQTYKEIEVLIIDDGSKDKTGKIADVYAEMDQRVRVIHTPNGGESRARNKGISYATGEYVAFCDADDYMHPDMLLKMYSAIENDNSEIAVCSWCNVDEDGNDMPWKTSEMESCVLSSSEAQKQFLLTMNIEGFCWNKLVKKDLYEKKQIRYDDRKYSFCDVLANYRLLKNASVISYVGEALYDYVQVSTSCVHTLNTRKDIDYLNMLKEVYNEAIIGGYEKQGKVYVVNRMQKYLHEMYKDKNRYEYIFIKDYFKKAYEGLLDVSFFRKVYYAFRFPVESPVKFIVKAWLVSYHYIEFK